MNNLQLKIIEINPTYCQVFKEVFKDYPNIEIINQPLETYQGEYDCIVSPANSFGLMDGGFDLAITNKFGTQLMKDVQESIIENYAGLQPVGTSFLVGTGDMEHPFLVHTPTMELPWDIRNTINVYLAMKSMLLTIIEYNKDTLFKEDRINTVLLPMFGGGCGMVSPESMAMQMKLAYDHVYNKVDKIDWQFANDRIREIIRCL